MRDLSNGLNLKPAFAPKAAVTDNTAQVSTTCDLLGYNSLMLAIITGTNADADVTYTVLIEESDNDSAYTAVADRDLIGTEALAGFQFDNDGECRKIGYNGGKRYVRATVTPANNTGNVFLAGVWVLGHPGVSPTSNRPA